MSKFFSAIFLLFCSSALLAQEDSLFTVNTLEQVVVSVHKWDQNRNEVPNKITRITRADIFRNNPQTAADMLAQSGTVFVQKSQLGGGSPMIRGFATNRVLLVVDGVRMNNAIYRSGNLQNVISIDPLTIQSAEVIFGPGSLVYGSDAIGGVMDFHTIRPELATDSKPYIRGSVFSRYSSANHENTGQAQLSAGGKKWALFSSARYSHFDDLQMGKYGGQDSYLRPEYVARQQQQDVILSNPNPRIQRNSGYDQLNLLQKLRFRPTKYLDLQYSFTYAATGDAPRYDRLIQYRSGALRFAEWYYGPMIWRMHNVQAEHTRSTALYDKARLVIAYQNYDESRVDRSRTSVFRNIQREKVHAANINWDAVKSIGPGRLFYGVEHVTNKVGSDGQRVNIETAESVPAVSRYPDGSNWTTSGIYGSYKLNILPALTMNTGLRYSYNTLSANFDSSFIKFPYEEAVLNSGALTGSSGLSYNLNENFQINATLSTGYRMPNVDDIGKLFESTPGIITVPNPGLRSEYAWNMELGIVKQIPEKLRIEVNGFYTLLTNAIVRRPFSFNGADSIFFDGRMSGVEALQNVARATVWGLQLSALWQIYDGISLETHANWVNGQETDDEQDIAVPLRHAPPFYGSAFLRYRTKKLFLETALQYNGEITNDKLAPSEQQKTDLYATDANGNPYSPSWYTINLRASTPIHHAAIFTIAWENITNRRYRPYSSGIVAAGANLVLSLKVSF